MRKAIAVAMMANLLATAAHAHGCDYKTPEKSSIQAAGTYSVAKVFGDSAGTSLRGSATLIDRRRKLFLTASHVVPGETAYFRFPGLGGNTIYEGRVIIRIPRATENGDGKSYDIPRDILVFQAEEIPKLARALDLRTLVNRTLPVTYFGYPKGGDGFSLDPNEPLSGAGSATTVVATDGLPSAAVAACTRVLRQPTLQGDSGSALIADGAFVVGVTLQAPQENKLNLFIPTGCFFDQIIERLKDDQAQEAYTLFTTQSETAVLAALAAPPSNSDISNIDLYIAAMRLMDDDKWVDILRCPIAPMAFERGIPIDGFARRATSAAQQFAIADALAISVSSRPVPTAETDEAEARLTLALTLYQGALPTKLNGRVNTVELARATFSQSDAVALKSAADTALLRDLLGAKTETDRMLAARTALLAAAVTDNRQLRGAALASYGQAVAEIDPQAAYSAFVAAKSDGFSPQWVSNLQNQTGKSLTVSERALAATPLSLPYALKTAF